LWAAAPLATACAVLLAVVLGPARAAGGTPLLPNLVADPPDNMSLATDSSSGEARLLLRFNGYVHNTGPGAVDFRGSREKPKVSKATEEQVERAREKQENLPQKVEEELAVPPMKVFQRLFTTAVGQEESNIERAHVEEASSGEMIYVSADGHHHWHLQRVAKYSLWNATKTAEVAPSQKVGFCLEDSQHVETGKGPSTAAYADNVAPFRDFCQQYRPNATSLFEGISPGWRDVYNRELSFQWVDASDVLPGEYWLREEVNPLGVIKEAGGGEKTKFATTATVIPGFDAQAKAATANAGQETALTLTSKAFQDTATPRYTIVSAPQHGTLGAVKGNQVTYVPAAGFTGTDSFTFSAADPNSPFPKHPAVATVSIEVRSSTEPGVTIEGAPAAMKAGTSVQLTAHVTNDSPTVTWAASSGQVTSGGMYTAPAEPPAGGSATVTATTSKGAKASVSIEIQPPAGAKALLAGDATATYAVGDQTTAGREEAFQFTAKTSGTVEELQFRTNGTANTGVSGLALGVFADSSGKPGTVLGQATASGTPATSSWIKATGLSTPVVAGTKYWLVALPKGSGKLHFNAAVSSGGSGNVESSATGLTTLTAESSWETYNQGPAGFQAIGKTESGGEPSVTIEGAPAAIKAGASVQLTAHVTNDSPTVTWTASAGQVTSAGLYTAPAEPPAGGSATVTATTSKGAKASVSIEIQPGEPSVTIEGAPASMKTGASVQLTAHVTNDSPTVTWAASSGQVTSAGMYTAPAEPPAGGFATVTATTSKGAKASVSIEIVAAKAGKVLLAGDATATYGVGDQTTAGREEAFQFAAKSTGTVEELQFRTNGTANTGVTGLALGVFADSAGKPGAVLGQATVSGTPAVSSWIKATGLSVGVTTGTKYWLVALPMGSGKLHFNAAASSGGAGNVESTTGGLSTLTAESSWETYNQGPVGFQALGPQSASKIAASIARVRRPVRPRRVTAIRRRQRVMIEAPAIVTAGTGVQLSALATGGSGVRWSVSAGSIGAAGVFRAPARAGTVRLRATSADGSYDQRLLTIAAPSGEVAAPTAFPPEARRRAVAAPVAMVVGRQLVATTVASRPGLARITAWAGSRRLGSCSVLTPAGRSFTCRLVPQGTPAGAAIRVVASLRAGAATYTSVRPTAPVTAMKMLTAPAGTGRWKFICSPSATAAGAL
jgi:hypothetical protein